MPRLDEATIYAGQTPVDSIQRGNSEIWSSFKGNPIYEDFTDASLNTEKWANILAPSKQATTSGKYRMGYQRTPTPSVRSAKTIDLTKGPVTAVLSGASAGGHWSLDANVLLYPSGAADSTNGATSANGLYFLTNAGASTIRSRYRYNGSNGTDVTTTRGTHKYLRFRALDATTVVHELSPDNVNWTLVRTSTVQYPINSMRLALSSGYWEAGGDADTATTNGWIEWEEIQIDPKAVPVDLTARWNASVNNDQVSFSDSSLGSPTSWAWDFGDKTTSTLKSPTHAYDAPGTYNVSLTVVNGGSTRSLAKNVVVTQIAPKQPRFFGGFWVDKLADNAALEDRATHNGTNDATENRANVPYQTRFASIAKLHSGTTPVAGFYANGDNTITSDGASPMYIIPTADHHRQKVFMLNDDGTEMWPGTDNNLPSKFYSVPVPQGQGGQRFEVYFGRSLEQAGSDLQLNIYDKFTDELWEMFGWRWVPELNAYAIRWGGYTANATGSGATVVLPNTWGARATSLPMYGGIITRTEWEEGIARHPLGVAIPVVKPGWIAPATREDGTITWHVNVTDGLSKGRYAVPEGAWFRLPATYVVNENRYPTKPEKSRLHAIMCRSARDYGIIVTDGTGGTMTFQMEGDHAINTPYSPLSSSSVPVYENYSAGYTAGVFYGNDNHLKDFPWDSLVQVKYGG